MNVDELHRSDRQGRNHRAAEVEPWTVPATAHEACSVTPAIRPPPGAAA